MFDLGGSVTLTNCTLVSNTADDGGAMYALGYDGYAASASTEGAAGNQDASVVLRNDVLAGTVTTASFPSDLALAQPATVIGGQANAARTGLTATEPNIVDSTQRDPNGGPTISSTPAGLSGANPLLGSLAFNGGPGMLTVLPANGSPVLGAGDPAVTPATDERGVARPAAGPVDLGAVQLSTPPTTTTTPSTSTGTTTGGGGAGTHVPRIALQTSTITVTGSTAPLTLDCVLHTCKGNVALTVQTTITIDKGRTTIRRHVRVGYADGAYTAAAGKNVTVRLTLTKAATKALQAAKHRRLTVTASVTVRAAARSQTPSPFNSPHPTEQRSTDR